MERWYNRVLSEQLLKGSSRQQFWTKAIAAGDEPWLKEIAAEMGIKRYKIFEHENNRENSKINFQAELYCYKMIFNHKNHNIELKK
jgi:hypothetical protein